MRPAFKRRHINLTAQSRNRKRNWDFTVQVIALPLKDLMFLNVYDDIKIARRTTASAGFPVAQRTQPRTLPDSSGYFQLNAAQFFDASVAATFLTRFLNDFASAAAAGTRLRNLKKSAGTNHLPTAAARRAGNAARTRFSPAPLAFVASA